MLCSQNCTVYVEEHQWNVGFLKNLLTQLVTNSWEYLFVLLVFCLSLLFSPSLLFPLLYSLYQIKFFFFWSSFSCRHNENWQDTLLLPLFLVLPQYHLLHSLGFSMRNTIFFHQTRFLFSLSVCLTLSCSNFFFTLALFIIIVWFCSVHLPVHDWSAALNLILLILYLIN